MAYGACKSRPYVGALIAGQGGRKAPPLGRPVLDARLYTQSKEALTGTLAPQSLLCRTAPKARDPTTHVACVSMGRESAGAPPPRLLSDHLEHDTRQDRSGNTQRQIGGKDPWFDQ